MLSVENHQDINEGQSGVRGHISNDIFSLGCVFYRFLTEDRHPFMEGLGETQTFAQSLTRSRLKPDKDERPQINKVKQEMNSHLNK
ncbi:hypothetical protein DAPPUDRAFT_318375 [Daphnia pulex]|uniref:Protein kinase domain-containing protein n=1 Tax=Daphnia pulex TaxID=6669 RepID=E9GIL6_DAPPU|nr:hypothetical protein DAPPUDRAFT_318375 [Daphnia pulex]|eukprot:EFX80731.1 hypothetical protein DAPPUDRAFT_318375 [Daphnia pulex]